MEMKGINSSLIHSIQRSQQPQRSMSSGHHWKGALLSFGWQTEQMKYPISCQYFFVYLWLKWMLLHFLHLSDCGFIEGCFCSPVVPTWQKGQNWGFCSRMCDLHFWTGRSIFWPTNHLKASLIFFFFLWVFFLLPAVFTFRSWSLPTSFFFLLLSWLPHTQHCQRHRISDAT